MCISIENWRFFISNNNNPKNTINLVVRLWQYQESETNKFRKSRRQKEKYNILGFLVLPKTKSLCCQVHILSLFFIQNIHLLLGKNSKGESIFCTYFFIAVQALFLENTKNIFQNQILPNISICIFAVPLYISTRFSEIFLQLFSVAPAFNINLCRIIPKVLPYMANSGSYSPSTNISILYRDNLIS